MKPGFRLALGAYLLLEIWATLEIAAWLGAARTVLLLILGILAGIVVLRREKLAVVAHFRHASGPRQPFIPSLPDRALRAAAGLLLIVPGFVSDAAALILLVPQLRRWLIRHWSARLSRSAGVTVIEGEFHRLDEMIRCSAKESTNLDNRDPPG